MKRQRITEISLKACTALLMIIALVFTFTVSDYYIFNKIGEFNAAFVISQWIKKTGLLLLPLAVFCKRRSCADIAKYLLPVFVIISMFTYGNFFNLTKLTADAAPADKVYAHINEFIGKPLNMSLFFISCGLYLIICGLLFLRDGFKISAKSFVHLPAAILAVMPLNIFENFFDINNFSADHFLRFKNFTIWHFLSLAALAGFTIGAYYFLRKKDTKKQQDYLIALAVVLLIQSHSKESVIMGDGYNVYKTVFACVPLYICNIGVYVAALSVALKKRVLYAMSFFIHAVGALAVFVYYAKDEMSDYGLIFSYTILYFCITHGLLFALCVLPTVLGHYKFRPKDCIIPLVYYAVFIVLAIVLSGVVTSASKSFSYDGYTLKEDEWIYPNYSFSQENPFPVEIYNVPVNICGVEFNLLYLILLNIGYVALYWAFIGAYYAFIALRRRVLKLQ